MNSAGDWLDPAPVYADYGDIVPFLLHFGEKELVRTQLDRALSHVDGGIFSHEGSTRLFFNHDWLLGLLDAYRQTEDDSYLEVAKTAATTLQERYVRDGLLLNEQISWKSVRSFLGAADPFNGGFIELYLELFEITKDEQYYKWASALADAWISNKTFLAEGLFPFIRSARYGLLDKVLLGGLGQTFRLFKDNTNLLFGLASLYEWDQEERWKMSIERWIRGFSGSFHEGGKVYGMIKKGERTQADLRAAFSALDLLCDLHQLGVGKDTVGPIIAEIAEYWLARQWENGLWPLSESRLCSHLDANTDLAVALTKVFSVTGDERYWQAYARAKEAIPTLHECDFGYVLSVDQEGCQVDSLIKIKYQSLILKLELLPDNPTDVYQDPQLKLLVRDR